MIKYGCRIAKNWETNKILEDFSKYMLTISLLIMIQKYERVSLVCGGNFLLELLKNISTASLVSMLIKITNIDIMCEHLYWNLSYEY